MSVAGEELPVQSQLRFLGVGITRTGALVPWKEAYNDRLHAIWNRLEMAGFGASPIPFSQAYKIFVQPAIFFGAELWGLEHLRDVMHKKKSPFVHPRMKPLLEFLKQKFKLPKDGFNLPLLILCKLKSLFIAAY